MAQKYERLVICLHGDDDTGKTSTLRTIGEILRHKGISYVERKEKSGSSDRRMVIDVFGRKIGIGTYGDNMKLVDENIKHLSQYDCEIVVTASRRSIDRASQGNGKSLAQYLQSAAIWNIAKVKVVGNDVHIMGVEEILHYVVKAARSHGKYCDKTFN